MNIQRDFPKYLNIAAMPDKRIIASNHFEINGTKTKYIKDAPLIKVLSEMLGFVFKIHLGNGEFGDALPNGNWTGLIGMVQRREADMGIGKLSMTDKRAAIVDFSYPYLYSALTFATDKPTHSPNKYAMLNPFSPCVWIAVAISLILIQCVSYISSVKQKPDANLSLKIFGSLLEQSVNSNPHSRHTKIIVFSWVIGAMFISQIYKAILLSFLTFPTLTGIRDIAQLSIACQDSSFKCSAFKGSKTYTEFLLTSGESWNKIGKCLIRSNMFTDNVHDFLRPSTYGKAFIGTKTFMKAFKRSYFISDDYFYVDLYSIAIQKSFCCKDTLDKAIHQLAAVGILHKFATNDEFFYSLEYGQLKEELNSIKQLTFEELFGAFIILLLGYIISFSVLLIEISFSYATHRNRRKKKIEFQICNCRERKSIGLTISD